MIRRSRSFAVLLAATVLAAAAMTAMTQTSALAQSQGGRGGGGGSEAGGGSDIYEVLLKDRIRINPCLSKACLDLVVPRPRPRPRPVNTPRLERTEKLNCDGHTLGRDPATGHAMVVQTCAARRG